MKKIILVILSLTLIAGVIYFTGNLKPKPDETKTQAEPENSGQTIPPANTNDNDLTVPGLEDFDQEVQNLDQSINQL